MLLEGEAIDKIPGSDLEIIQNRGKFSYGIDAILLSEFAKSKGEVVDLGTGTGIILMRILARQNIKRGYGIEVQTSVAEMAKRSISHNNIDNIEIINEDLNNLENIFKKHSIDTVVSNPPYMKNDGIINKDENLALSRHEILCSIEDIARVSSYLLKPLGKLYLVHRPDRLVDIIYQLREHGLEAKRLRMVQPKINRAPNLILIEAVKGGKSEIRVEKPLIVYNERDEYTQEIMNIYYGRC